MILSELDARQCDSTKLVKEMRSQMNRSQFRKVVTGGKKSIEMT